MECPACYSEDLTARVVVVLDMPVAKRGDSVKVGGVKLSTVVAKDQWESQEGRQEVLDDVGDEHRAPNGPILGPITCNDCSTRMVFIKGAPNNPYVGEHLEARILGANHFINGGTMVRPPRGVDTWKGEGR